MSDKKSTDSRYRNFASIVYPESAVDNWQSILSDNHIASFISPLHDKDINPTGEPKKPHYHVILMFDSVKTSQQAQEIFQKIGAVGCEVVKSIRGYARYLCHLDNPEKAQYDVESVRSLCGADYNHVIGLAVDRYKAIREIIQFCKDNRIYSYATLFEYCMTERSDWFRVLCDNGSYVIDMYLKSKHWTDFRSGLDSFDPETGEVFNGGDPKNES